MNAHEGDAGTIQRCDTCKRFEDDDDAKHHALLFLEAIMDLVGRDSAAAAIAGAAMRYADEHWYAGAPDPLEAATRGECVIMETAKESPFRKYVELKVYSEVPTRCYLPPFDETPIGEKVIAEYHPHDTYAHIVTRIGRS